MAHNLNFNNGKTSFMSVKEKAWHGLGQVVENAVNSEEAIKLAGLDWKVRKEPALTPGGLEIPGTFSITREDNNQPLGGVGSRYTPLQNVEAFDFFDSIVGKREAIYETAGCLGNGETIFITAKLPEYIHVGKDVMEQYLFFMNTHDGGALSAMFTPIPVVCNNTVNLALRNNTNRIKIGHKKNVSEKVKQAHKLMGIVSQYKEEVEQIFNAMAKVRIVDAQLKDLIVNTLATQEFLNSLAKPEEVSERARTNFETLIGDVYAYANGNSSQQTDSAKGTLFGAYSAITGYFQNVKEYRNGNESKLVSIMKGDGADLGQKAFELCTALM
jgi:phage/plasmid-like protein (TIGR03299 family)